MPYILQSTTSCLHGQSVGHTRLVATKSRQHRSAELTKRWRKAAYLHESEVLLPPDVLGVHADEVICVHYRVNKTVQHHCEVDVAIIPGVDVQPVELRRYSAAATESDNADFLPPSDFSHEVEAAVLHNGF